MIKLIIMAALLFVSGAAMAQKVVEGADGAAIIDNRGMPAGAVTTAKKARITDATTITTITNGTNNLTNIASEESNKTVSHYFEVMKTDHASATWLGAISSCASYDSGDGKQEWRLPTQRELMLIWTLHATLIKKVPGFTKLDGGGYWTATGYSTTPIQAWYVSFDSTQDSNGTTHNNAVKTLSYAVRCVRDVMP